MAATVVELLGVHDGLAAFVVCRGGRGVDATLALAGVRGTSGTGSTGSNSASAEGTSTETGTGARTDRVTLTVGLGTRTLSIEHARTRSTGSRAETTSGDARVIAGAHGARAGTETVIVGQLVGARRAGRVVAAGTASGSDASTDVLRVAVAVVSGANGTGPSERAAGSSGESGIAGAVLRVRVSTGGRAGGQVLAEGSDTGTGTVCVAYMSVLCNTVVYDDRERKRGVNSLSPVKASPRIGPLSYAPDTAS